MRTFVFISDIPEFVLQPTYADGNSTDATGQQRRSSSNRDPRYERLRRMLADHSSGVMLVMHLETRGYGLALYASEEEALAACRATIIPEQPGMQYPPLQLRIVEKEKPLPPEPVYTPYITVEGEQVAKASLAVTRGLDLAYRGRSVPKWCPLTLEGKDCRFGMNCHRIHKAAVQRTVRKRPRIDTPEGTGTSLSSAEAAKVTALLDDGRRAEEVLVPVGLRPSPPSVYIPVALAEVEALLSSDGGGLAELAARVKCALVQSKEGQQLTSASCGAPFFARLSFPGGAPWDWSLHCDEGLCALRQRCPLPANGAPTPLERDLMGQRLFYFMNRLNAFTTVEAALLALSHSANVAQGFANFTHRHRELSHSEGQRRSSERRAEGSGEGPASKAAHTMGDAPLHLVLSPWLSLPTVGCEVSAFLERGGRRVRGIVQRYGQLRLMLPSNVLADGSFDDSDDDVRLANKELEKFVIIGAEQDIAAEAAMEEDIRRRSRLFTQAVETLRRHISTQSEREGGTSANSNSSGGGAGGGGLPAHAAWCAQLAIETTHGKGGAREERVVVLSFKPYQQALEECPMYTYLTNISSGGGGSSTNAGEVSWNTQKHPYVPLFSRETLEKLR